MLIFRNKIKHLELYLYKEKKNYADSFKNDIIIYFDENFSTSNKCLNFLKYIKNEKDIENWVDNLLSRFVMKFDGEFEQETDFIFDYLTNG
ncbi:MAG: hypothetical protein IIB95_04220 [Candidatus Marinimicrobia bacterium]|nr:hypothetical protein [Candidatus Neomarinimicrobiota bacterium]